MIHAFYTFPTLHIYTKGLFKIEKIKDEFHISVDMSIDEFKKLCKEGEYYGRPTNLFLRG